MIIALDFDGTVVEHDFPRIGDLKPDADVYLRKIVEDGHRLVLWTCRKDGTLIDAIQFMKEIGVELTAANTNDPSVDFTTSDKIYYDIIIDDRIIGGLPDSWAEIYEMVKKEAERRAFRY